MKSDNFILFLISFSFSMFVFAGSVFCENANSGTVFKDLNGKEASAMIGKNSGNPDFIILDVRTKSEFDQGHVDKALNMDYYSASFKDDLNRLDKTKKYLVYCRSGHRSGETVKMMKTMGFREVYNLSGGAGELEKAGLKLVK
jgi:rhodanese-related sulfurtransferase